MMEEEKHMREKIIKEVMKKKTVDIIVKNHVEWYKQKMTWIQKRK